MKKNLVYYSVGLKDSYAELLKLSVSKMDLYNKNQDILIITNKSFYEKNFTDYKRNNTYFHFTDYQTADDIAFNRLKVFDYDLTNYENILYIDVDLWINLDLASVFNMCLDNNKLYAVVEDYRFTNHFRQPFSLGTYTEEDLDFFTENNIHTFNSGLLMFKNTKNMKNHFQDVLYLRTVFPDGQFTEQPYLNF